MSTANRTDTPDLITQQNDEDARERRFWASMAQHARLQAAAEGLGPDALKRAARVIVACERASALSCDDETETTP